jgi:uncharacterized protein YbaP (TraB family)
MICQKDMFSEEKLKGYFNQTEQLILEIDMDDEAVIQEAVKGMMLADGKTVREMVKPEEYARIDELFKSYVGISFDNLQRFKPMAAQTFLLSSPKILGCQPPVVYDDFLSKTAVAAKKPVVGLETVAAQLAAVDSQPLDLQLRELNETALKPEKMINDFKTLYRIYLTQSADDIYKLVEAQFKAYGYSQEKMLDRRNLNWIPSIEKNILEKPSFIAVGGGHLGGEKGVINLLRAKGYKLTPIKL